MMTVAEAFKKFRTRLELTDREQEDASRRHNEIRDYLKTKADKTTADNLLSLPRV